MGNIITINGQEIIVTTEQLEQLQTALGIKKKRLADIAVGEVVTIAGIEWIVLDHFNGMETLCLTKDFVGKGRFADDTNNYRDSEARIYLNGEFYRKLTDAVNAKRIVSAKIDLTSDDGLDNYGSVCDKVGLMTDSMYRKYNQIIRKYPVYDWWWTATPYSTKTHAIFTVRCVSHTGSLSSNCCRDNNGVRPCCIFKSSISVS